MTLCLSLHSETANHLYIRSRDFLTQDIDEGGEDFNVQRGTPSKLVIDILKGR